VDQRKYSGILKEIHFMLTNIFFIFLAIAFGFKGVVLILREKRKHHQYGGLVLLLAVLILLIIVGL